MSARDDLIAQLLVREGGVADVGDGKGVTRWGQTPAWLEQFGLPTPRTPEEAAANYSRWIELIHFEPVVDVGDDLADILLDVAVMSDSRKAVKALQAALGLSVDGVLGLATLSALASADRRKLAREVLAWDIAYQGRLITLDSSRARYAAGWAARMAEHVRKLV